MVNVRVALAAFRPFVAGPLADWLLAAAFALAAEVDVLLTVPGPSWWQVVCLVRGLGVLGLGFRRKLPLLAVVVLCGPELAAVVVVKDPQIGGFGPWSLAGTIALALVAYSLGAHAGLREVLLGLPLTLVTIVVSNALWLHEHSVAEALPFAGTFMVGLPALAGWVVRDRSRLIHRLREQTSALEAEGAARVGRALNQERLRISSALHQVVSSTIHGLLAQIAAAEAGSRADGLRAVTEVETIARQGLAEMRRLLAALTGPDRPTRLEISGLNATLAEAARSGVDVVQSGQNDNPDLEPAVELAAVRAIQLFVDDAPDGSRVEVKRQPAGIELLLQGRRSDDFSRRALLALRERAALVGGTVELSRLAECPGLRMSLPAHAHPVTSDAQLVPPPVGEPMEQRPRLTHLPWPALLAVADFVLLEAQVPTAGLLHGPRLLNALAVLAVAAPLAWCRRRTLVAAACSTLAYTVMSVTLTPVGSMAGATLLWLVLPFSVAAFSDRRHALLGLGICGAAWFVSVWLGLPGFSQAIESAGIFCTFVLGAWVAGLVVRDRSRLAEELRQTNQRLIQEREATAQQVVLEKRARVAHELHDVIGHSVTVIVLQAGAARRVWDTDRASAFASLAALTRVARGGLTELLQSLDSLDAMEQPFDGPKLEELKDVLEMARLAGACLELRVDGARARLSPAVELAAYRVVQEALTNAMKHAPGCPVLVAIRYGHQAMALEVRDELPVAPPGGSLTATGGHGLAGMQQRIQACGGTLEWGRQDGAFSVQARLPVLG